MLESGRSKKKKTFKLHKYFMFGEISKELMNFTPFSIYPFESSKDPLLLSEGMWHFI
jgi:hypothetical protein